MKCLGCGAENPESNRYCGHCGNALANGARIRENLTDGRYGPADPEYPDYPVYPDEDIGYGKRPTGVTVLAVLAILMILGSLLVIVVFAWVIGFMGNPDFLQAMRDAGAPQFVIDNLSLIFTLYILLFALYAVIYALLAYSFFAGARWGWGLGVGFSVFIIAFSIVMFILTPSLSGVPGLVIQLIIYVLILYYINTPPVITWFKGPGARGLWGGEVR
jgi:hypothetical protein